MLNENFLKALVFCLTVALAIASTLTATFYQRQILLRQDLEELQDNYEQLQNSYVELHQQQEILQENFEELRESYERLQGSYAALSQNYSGLLNCFGSLTEQYSALSAQYSNLTSVYRNFLSLYDELSGNYRVLSENYSALIDSHKTLQEKYFSLNELYLQLQSDYIALKDAYNSLVQLWNGPLPYVTTPSIEEVVEWLRQDKTDSIQYEEGKFMCGDFTVMLIQHAKEMNWRMLFTVIEFDFYEENPDGIPRHHGNHAHAFASIFTTEGIIYIEPQTDLVFYVYEEEHPGIPIEIPEWTFLNATIWFGGVIFVQYCNRMANPIEYAPQNAADPHLEMAIVYCCLLYTSPSPRDISGDRMPSSA